MSDNTERKLVAILFADIQGYTAMMQSDEARSMNILRHYQKVLKKEVTHYNGEIVKNYGDGSLCLFSSVLDAVRCARVIQEIFRTEPVIPLRVGLHLGDVMYSENDVYGHDLNVASRIESMGIAGSVLMSKNILDKVKNHTELQFASLGRYEFKNVEDPIEIYALANDGFVVPKKDQMQGKLKTNTKRQRAWLIPALLVALITIFGGYYFFSPESTTVDTDIDAITVFPFDIKSANAEIQYLGQGMVDLISTKLDGVPNIIPIDPNRIFNELKKENETIPSLEKAIEVSNTLGAAEFILGSIIELNDILQISASKYDTKGKLVTKEYIEGQKSDLVGLINDLTRVLIADKLEREGQELNSLAVMTSDNFPALKAYLEGEQAYRATNFGRAFDFYETAVNLDSTFALAWLRLHDADGWVGLGTDEKSLRMARKYADKLPPKWQDLLEVQEVFKTGRASNENVIANMLRKYGENPQFTNLMAEHLFHYNPFYGRSIIEAKPWLQKTWELDPGNQEAFRHLAHIAYVEGDTARLKEIIAELSSESGVSKQAQLLLMAWRDSVPENELKTFAEASPRLHARFFTPSQAIPDDPMRLLEIGERFIPYLENTRHNHTIPRALSALRGQDKETIAIRDQRDEISPPSEENMYLRMVRPASVIAHRDFLPYMDQYADALDFLSSYDEPRAFFASAKYAWALQKEALYDSNKQKLFVASQKSQGVINPARHYYWTLAAFEARHNNDYEKALVCIDSVFQYTPVAGYYGEASLAIMDKAFMLADIYEEQGAYEKAIQRLENLPLWTGYNMTKGYATYRLTQLYEKSGHVNKALSKSNLFLKNYKDCDDQYRPWWDEVYERQQRLMNTIN